MKRIWQGIALGCECSIELDAGELRVFRIDGIRPHAIPEYRDLVIKAALVDIVERLEKHEPLVA